MTHLRRSPRQGMSLIEIMLATVILSVAAVAVMYYVRQPTDRVKVAACDVRIEQLQVLSRQYQKDFGRVPNSNPRELTGDRYLGQPLPVCPVDGRAYRLDRSGAVVPHNHILP